jgi:mycothiol maleylpyruvate isomerase-like protein
MYIHQTPQSRPPAAWPAGATAEVSSCQSRLFAAAAASVRYGVPMSRVVDIDERAVRDALTAAAERTALLAASIDDAGTPAPHLQWSVGEVAAHLGGFCLPAFTDAVRGREASWLPLIPEVDGFRERLAGANARTLDRAPVPPTDELVHMIRDGARSLLLAVEGRGGDEVLHTPWYGPGATLDLTTVLCVMLGELLVHAQDIARGLRRPWHIDAAEARLVVGGVFTAMIPRIVDPVRARGVHATYEIRAWGGPRFVNRVDDGVAVAEPFTGQSVDCHLIGDPVELMLVGYGRRSQWTSIARGRLHAWGRRPWLGLRWKGLYLNP